jgi:uncharacterized repeat protein (TIGR01451 family)
MARRRWSFMMSPIEHGFIRRLDDGYRGWLTPTGRMLAWATLAGVVLLSGGLVAPLVLLVAAMSSALIAGAALGLAFRPRLTLTRLMPAPASAGDTLEYRVRVENTGRRAAYQVVLQERGLPAEVRPVSEPEPIEVLRPGESRHVTLKLACQRRGAYTLDRLQAASAFPSALVKWGRRSGDVHRLLVFPRLRHLEAFEVPASRNHQPGGIAVASQVGDSTEFFGTRDYRDGDRLRDVHWASTARTGRLVVKEFQEEYFVRLALVLDVEVRDAKQEDRFEEGLSIAAGIADVLARKDFIIDLFAAGREVHHFRAGRALAHVENILELMACLEPGDRLDVNALEAELLPEASRLSAVILVMMDWEPRRAALVARLKERGVTIRVLALGLRERPRELAVDEWVEAA